MTGLCYPRKRSALDVLEEALGVATHLFLWFEDVAAEHIALAVSCYVTEDLQILRVVRYVEYPVKSNERDGEKNYK